MNEYAKDNKDELILNCKLALARMGDKNYEKEILSQYRNMEIDCSREDFSKPLNNLFYINTRNSIQKVIEFSKNNKIYQGLHPDAYKGIVMPPCSVKHTILLYLVVVIKNYPIRFEYHGEDENYFLQFPSLIQAYTNAFYLKQFPELEKWLKQNSKTYQINTERFF
jgi:hypothetical protein